MIDNKINEIRTLLQIKSLFKKIYLHMAIKIWQRVKTGYLAEHNVPELWGRITKCSTTRCWEYLASWNLRHDFFAGSGGIFC